MIESALLDDAHFNAAQRELLEITWRLLEAIHTGDAVTYAELCAPELSCFEDVCAYRIDGLDFHIALIGQMAQNPDMRPTRFDMLTPRAQVYGDHTGIVTYTRLMTHDREGLPKWQTFNETRVFIKQKSLQEDQQDEQWKMVHFHRSPT